MVPVIIFTYVRLDHLKRTITSLQNNILAEQTDLFIASDSHRTESEADRVIAVRNYLRSVDGFKSVTIFEREKNFGMMENFYSGTKAIFNNHNRLIVLEEDIVTAPGFLKFMNEAFEKYGGNEKVFSITGYCPPIKIPPSYQHDAFFLGRMNTWGCGITKDRYESVREITRKEFDEFTANKMKSRAFVKGGGNDLLRKLKKVAYGLTEAWDVQCMYTQFLKNQYTVYPTQSLTLNIGFDGTGVHCTKTDGFVVTLSDKTTFRFPDDPVVDPQIVKANLAFRNGTTIQRARAFVSGKTPEVIKQLLR